MKVLMVCLGNICRSPLAQGIMEQYVQQRGLDWTVDSAGTSGWHNGNPPDARSIAIARLHGIDISHQRSRLLVVEDLDNFDLILAMDSSNYQNILNLDVDKIHADKIKLILNYVYPTRNMAVPDPYYDNGFENVYNLLDKAILEIVKEH